MEFHHGFLEEIMLDSNIDIGGFGMNDNKFDLLSSTPPGPATVVESSPLSQTSSSQLEDFCLQNPFCFEPQTTLNCSSSFGPHLNMNPPNFVDHELLLSDLHQHRMSTPAANIKLESSPTYDQDNYYYYSMFSMLDAAAVHDHLEMPHPQGTHPEPEIRPPFGFKMGRQNIIINGKAEGGQPASKNLMAERRRRKRLNDRLSMLRSVVPKISKMDRTSILADTIDYMKELLEKIKRMQQELEMEMEMEITMDSSSNLVSAKPKDIFIRNSPKFEVERRKTDTRVQVCCSGKPELLISTVSTLEALGLQIQQCVISCFNDFTMHASCSEEMEQRLILNTDDIKQALFRNAGYGGRCL